MIKLSKKIEYALLAIQFISASPKKQVTAKEISDSLGISFEFLSKTLQQLIKSGIVLSAQGTKGGYVLDKNPESITVADIIDAIEGKHPLVNCLEKDDPTSCERSDNCSIRHSISDIQTQIENVFNNITIAEMAKINFQNNANQITTG